MASYILAIDQGTTSSRAILFDENAKEHVSASQEFEQFFPHSGWVEHDPEEIWQSVLTCVRKILDSVDHGPESVAAIGITNQRETVVVWDRSTGKAIHKAIVWQDRRTAAFCQALKSEGAETLVREKTGLLLDPYFSASKIKWILDKVPGAMQQAQNGELAFGTIDSFLVWRLTGGAVHVTDASNAARTSLFNIHDQAWDKELLKLFGIPMALMPKVKDNAADFGTTVPSLFGKSLAISGMAGDQQAATVGQACFQPGMMKATYGTGCFALMNTGAVALKSENRLLTTIAYRLKGQVTYALEGSIFIAGAGVQWLRDGLKILPSAEQSGPMADLADPEQNLYLVPAFTGLGAPHWDADVRGAIFGMTRNTGPNELAKATLDAVCYQTQDLMQAMKADGAPISDVLRVDGGMVRSDWFMQRLSDLLGLRVERPENTETTALGAAYLAGYQIGLYGDQDDFAQKWSLNACYTPSLETALRDSAYQGWTRAVQTLLAYGR